VSTVRSITYESESENWRNELEILRERIWGREEIGAVNLFLKLKNEKRERFYTCEGEVLLRRNINQFETATQVWVEHLKGKYFLSKFRFKDGYEPLWVIKPIVKDSVGLLDVITVADVTEWAKTWVP